MTDRQIPTYLQDADQLISENGFKTSNVWYHGTASGLIESIQEKGLLQSGDKESNARAKKTMSTIGGSYKENKDPICLSQSKELAYFWAEQATKQRNLRFGGNEEPVVVAISLPDDLNSDVKPDVGAAAMLIIGNAYTDELKTIYEKNGLTAPDVDPMNADRMEYLSKLGLAYYKKNIDPQYIQLVTE